MNTACEVLLRRSSGGLTVRGGRFSAAQPNSNRELHRLIHALTAAGHRERREAHVGTIAITRPDRLPILAEGLSMAALGLDHTIHAHSILISYDPDCVPSVAGTG